MVALVMGSGTTIKSTTCEKAILELASFIKVQERDSTKNPNNQDNIGISVTSTNALCTITFTIPCNNTRLADGSFQLKANNYLTNVTYVSGSGTDDLRGGNALQDFVDLIQLVQGYEDDPVRNVTLANNVTGDFNSEPWRFEGTATLTYSEVVNVTGGLVVSVKEYLS